MAGEGAVRTADALLRANGGRTVLLRLPEPPVAGDEQEALGLATPTFRDAELAPAVFRKAGSTATLLVSADAVARLTNTWQSDSAEALFRSAAGILIDGVTYGIETVVAEQFFGTAYCYAVSLAEPAS